MALSLQSSNETGAISTQLGTVDTDLKEKVDTHDSTIQTELVALSLQSSNETGAISTQLGTVDTDLKEKVDTHDSTIQTELVALSLQSSNETGVLIDELDDHHTLINGHANPDPFAIELKLCTTLGGEAGLEGTINVGANFKGEATAGVDAYGNGLTLGGGQ